MSAVFITNIENGLSLIKHIILKKYKFFHEKFKHKLLRKFINRTQPRFNILEQGVTSREGFSCTVICCSYSSSISRGFTNPARKVQLLPSGG